MKIERVLLYVFFGFLAMWMFKRTSCSSCNIPTTDFDFDFSKGSGKVISENRSVEAFDRITVDGVIDLEISQGEVPSVRIEADEKYQEKIKTRVDDGRLTISMRGFSFKNASKIRAFITVKDLRELTMTGVGDAICATPLKLEKLEANLSGVGKIILEGKCDDAEIVNSGAGGINAASFVCQKLSVDNSGVGNVQAYAEREIQIENTGVGNVEWSGGANLVNSENTGIGKIKKI